MSSFRLFDLVIGDHAPRSLGNNHYIRYDVQRASATISPGGCQGQGEIESDKGGGPMNLWVRLANASYNHKGSAGSLADRLLNLPD